MINGVLRLTKEEIKEKVREVERVYLEGCY